MIQVSNLTRYYGAFPALRDVSFEVRQGEIIGLLGLNGAGKSTTLKILAGVLTPSRGKVTYEGRDVTDNGDVLKANIGFLPEDPPLYRDMTVSAFLVHCAQLKGVPAATARERLPEVISTTGLRGRERQVIGTLSHGFKKRVGIAMAVIHDPRLVILDEPISGLDPRQIREMRDVIRRLGQGRAVLLSSHILSEISRTCDRLLVVHEGRLVASGTMDELTAHLSDDRIVVTVRGDAPTFQSWLDANARVREATVVTTDDGHARATVTLNGDIRETFLPEVAASGFGLRLVEPPEYELEDVFLGLTGGDA